MASIAVLTYSSQHQVQVDWGDGTIEFHPAAPPPGSGTIQHTYSGAGPWTITLTDTTNSLSSTDQITCSTCSITGTTLSTADAKTGTWTLGPLVSATGTAMEVDWGDGSAVDTVNSGDTAGHTYAPAAGPGPFTVTVTDPAVAGCTVDATGGNDPANPGKNTVIVPPTLTLACQAPSAQGEDVAALTIAGPTGATYNITWGDGGIDNGVTDSTITHTYALPAGVQRTVTVTQVQTTASASLSVTCDVAPVVTSLTCSYVANCTKEPASPVHQDGGIPTNVTFGPATQNWDVDWGDGTTVQSVTAGNTAPHSYTAPGSGVTVRYHIVFTSPTNPACVDDAQITIVGP